MGNIHIQDSYKISKLNFGTVLDNRESKAKLMKDEGELEVFSHRSRFSLKMEWTVHNFLYGLHIRREQTKDCDLDYPCDKPEWLYCLLGLLTWLFIN